MTAVPPAGAAGAGALDGDDAPAVTLELPWPAAGATAVDALGQEQQVTVRDGRLRAAVSTMPVFIGADVAGARRSRGGERLLT